MTIDDDKSIYVGGLRYDCNEDDLRRAFELYGSVVAVKIINDRGSAGKCYAFVTFTNPRSAMNAIHAMNGKTIGGRAVKVNEVRSRGAGMRSNYASEDTFRHNQRNIDFNNRGRGRKRDYEEHARVRYHDRSRQRERGYEFAQGDEPATDRFYDREEGFSRGVDRYGRGGSKSYDHESEHDRDHESDHQERSDRVDDQDKRIEEEKQDVRVDTDSFGRRIRKGKERHSRKRSRSSSHDRRTREISTDSSEDHHRSEGQLDSLVERREELIKEKSELELRLKEKNQDIVDLRRRSLKLEDALTSAKKVSSLRQAEFTKLYKCFLQVKDYGERLKNSEEELQALVESVVMDMDADSKDGYLQNGEV